jgi:hypothetical protein
MHHAILVRAQIEIAGLHLTLRGHLAIGCGKYPAKRRAKSFTFETRRDGSKSWFTSSGGERSSFEGLLTKMDFTEESNEFINSPFALDRW